MRSKHQAGFTLVEMAMVLFIVGLIIGGIMKMDSIRQAAQAKDVMTMIADISAAASSFKENYKYLPGDFPAADNEIANVPAICEIGGANAGDGDGVISATESLCVPEHLFRAGLTRATLNPVNGLYEFRSAFGTIQVMSVALSRAGVAGVVFPSAVQNVIEFAGTPMLSLPCNIALEIERKMDDGVLTSGNAVAIDATPAAVTCTPGGANDPVPFFDIAL